MFDDGRVVGVVHHESSPEFYWHRLGTALLAQLGSRPTGLSEDEAVARGTARRPTAHADHRAMQSWRLLASQWRSPLVWLLVAGSIISALTSQWLEASIVLGMVFGSVMLGFSQEFLASRAIARLRARLAVTARVRRGGVEIDVPVTALVPGDVLLLRSGSMIPADAVLFELNTLIVDESMLTGESFGVEKQLDPVPIDARLAERRNCVFQGTHVVSGSAAAVVVNIGAKTVVGEIGRRLAVREPDSLFERDVRSFGYLLSRIVLVMFVIVWFIHMMIGKPTTDSLLFALALAVGLTPELLPAIVSVTLAHGARRMAEAGVIVRRPDAIESLGTMTILCADKTGTLTTGRVKLAAALDEQGVPSPKVLRLAAINARLQAALRNTLDEALLTAFQDGTDGLRCIDEIPYDFSRRCVSVIVEEAGARHLLLKGAVAEVLERCGIRGSDPRHAAIDQLLREWSGQGYRVLAVAEREVPTTQAHFSREDEYGAMLRGFLLFEDPPKSDAVTAIAALQVLGVRVVLITGDNRHAAQHAAQHLNGHPVRLMTGAEIESLPDPALAAAVREVDVFAEVDPLAKERIIRALRTAGQCVGFLGDGVNDTLALRAADVGISVDTAVDVAKESADVVLLRKDLSILRQGIEQGRRTHANTLKYILTTLSANFGNMASLAIASVWLPFFPMTAAQVLLNNFLSDLPAMAIASDRVDAEDIRIPRRWDLGAIRRYMVSFGIVSACFDLLTFMLLIVAFEVTPQVFRAAWFYESLFTELVVALIVRTRLRCYRSRPGTGLWVTTLLVAAVAVGLPMTAAGIALGLVPLPSALIVAIAGLVLAYALVVEIYKARFYASLAAPHRAETDVGGPERGIRRLP